VAIDLVRGGLLDHLDRFIHIYVFLIVGLFVLGIGVDNNGAANRLQGLMSEPSALGFMLSYLFISKIDKKKYTALVFVVISAILTQSLVVFASIYFSLVLLYLSRGRVREIFLVLVTTLGVFGFLFLLQDVDSESWLLNKL